ncbi:receptor-like protein 12 [Sesamum indicum]|uniref:Receptor-like protein 12 n=1 Tax=Sesamum indicum TaxID=4182 RepID=A0A8M8VAD8_SESIN|nr:receptor-like protein 12 [Sesamum indicum]
MGVETAERLRVTCKVALRAAGYQGQHLSCEWVIETIIRKPRDPTHETTQNTRSRKLVLWNQTQDCYNWVGVECDGVGHVISLQLDGEGISGGIHNMSSLSGFRYLEKLNLAENNFRAQIPGGILNLKHLTHLNLSDAGFGGQVPIEVSLMRRLVTLDLLYNGLEIENPNLKMLLQNLTGLRELYLDGVQMSSAVLNFFANFSHPTTLSLSGCDLRGSFPNMIFQLPTLENLDLSFNQLLTGSILQFHQNASLRTLLLLDTNFSGPLPNSIASLDLFHPRFLTGLIYVDLSRNFFTGSIPSFYMSKNLQRVDLSDNSLSGSIPKSLFSLPSLRILRLSNNQLSGRVYEFSTLHFPHIVALDLSRNKLEGQIPKSFFTLERLETLKLSYNFFNGTVQLGKLQRLHNLVELDLSYNNLSIDTSITNTNLSRFPQLFSLSLASCNLHNFPDLTNQHNLRLLNLSNNRIIGEVPNWIWEIGNGTLIGLDLSSDIIPTSFCNATELEVLDLSSNKLSGSIPPCLVEKVEQLAVLKLGGNNINGHIPDTFSVYCRLEILDMSQNYLEGRLPVSLANCKSLQILNVGNNNIDDGFPCMLPSSLRVLVLRSNRFHGQVRCSRSWTDLQIIDIASNNFTGYLYTKSFRGMMQEKDARLESDYIHYYADFVFGEYYQGTVKVIVKGVELELVKILTIFTAIDFSCNNFQGEIPDAIGDLRSLHILNLSHNTFVGTIPKSLGKLTYIESVDLSTNQLTGEIPKELTRLTFLAVLNLSHNQLIGPIPSGPQFQTFSTDSFQGNIGLCGFPFNISCRHAVEEDDVPPPNPHQEDEAINWEYVSVALGYVVGLGSILWMLFSSQSFRHKFNDQTEQAFQKIFNAKNRRKGHRGRTNRRRQC